MQSNYTEKEAYEVVKLFKEVYTSLNNSNEIYLHKNVIYYPKEEFYIMYGKLKSDNVFTEWSKDKDILLKLEDIDVLRKALKKNVLSLDVTNECLTVRYTDKDNNEIIFNCENKIIEKYQDVITKVEEIENRLEKRFDITQDYFDEEIILLFEDVEGNMTAERNDNKIIEIASKRVKSYIRNSFYSLDYSLRDENKRRYVSLNSENDFLKLSQIFVTI
jgi:hypothetical protein